MNFLYFLGGFGVCYYLSQRSLLPKIEVHELNSQRIRFTVNENTYTLNVGEQTMINGQQVMFDGQTLSKSE